VQRIAHIPVAAGGRKRVVLTHEHTLPAGSIMMSARTARIGVGLVIVVAVAGAAFRVVTGPERNRARQDVARTGCLAAGGEWVTSSKSEFCKPAERERKP
jgi:hypothetical protein